MKGLAAEAVETVAHVILGLPGESPDMMFETASRCAALPLAGVKIHQLMIVRGTTMEQWYAEGIATPPARHIRRVADTPAQLSHSAWANRINSLFLMRLSVLTFSMVQYSKIVLWLRPKSLL